MHPTASPPPQATPPASAAPTTTLAFTQTPSPKTELESTPSPGKPVPMQTAGPPGGSYSKVSSVLAFSDLSIVLFDDSDYRTKFESTLRSSLASAAQVPEKNVHILGIFASSVSVRSSVDVPAEKGPADFARRLASSPSALLGGEIVRSFGPLTSTQVDIAEMGHSGLRAGDSAGGKTPAAEWKIVSVVAAAMVVTFVAVGIACSIYQLARSSWDRAGVVVKLGPGPEEPPSPSSVRISIAGGRRAANMRDSRPVYLDSPLGSPLRRDSSPLIPGANRISGSLNLNAGALLPGAMELVLWEDPGAPKERRVTIDPSHPQTSDWKSKASHASQRS